MCWRTVVCGRVWLWCPRGSRFFLASSFGSAIACSTSIVGFRGRLPPVGALCASTCVTLQSATCRRVEGGAVQILCVHLVVVSEREISAVVLCVGELCITMTKSGVCPNGCASKLQVDVKRVNHTRAVNSRFTRGLAVFVWGMLCCRFAW